MIWLTLLFALTTETHCKAEVHTHGGQASAPTLSGPALPTPAATSAPRKEDPRVPVEVPSEQQARMGLKTLPAEKKAIQATIRTVGTVTADQTREAHVHSRINGWIEQIYADYIGKPVKKGQPLFELYSPELVSTQEEYVAARAQPGAGREIARAALDRLKLWGVPQKEIDRLVQTRKSKRTLTFESPVDGFIVNKTAIRGMYINPEMELYYIADLSEIWVIVTLYEFDVSAISVGDSAKVELPYDPSKSFTGKISYIYPEIEPETRTARARVVIPNQEQVLKPGMFANVLVQRELGQAVVVPEDAVIDTGIRRLVFVKTGASHFEPREIKTGPRVAGQFAVLSGLKEGENAVTSAHFLIDAESKLQAAIQKGGQPKQGGHGTHGGK